MTSLRRIKAFALGPVAFWIGVMSGVLSLLREVVFGYLASIGRPVTPNASLSVFGHLAIGTFMLYALTVVFASRAQLQSQSVLDQLEAFRADGCQLLARGVRNDADLKAWKIKVNTWNGKVRKYLKNHFPAAVASRFDFIGLHVATSIPEAFSREHEDWMRWTDYRTGVLAGLVGTGIAT